MSWPLCAWCGGIVIGHHRVLYRPDGAHHLHFTRCTLHWLEVERALGHALPGEPIWRPAKGRK